MDGVLGGSAESNACTVWMRRDAVNVWDVSALRHPELQYGVINLTCRKWDPERVRDIVGGNATCTPSLSTRSGSYSKT